jgi:hypothetical protein
MYGIILMKFSAKYLAFRGDFWSRNTVFDYTENKYWLID